MAPVHAISTTAAKTIVMVDAIALSKLDRPNKAAAMVAAMTATPPPCGVGAACEERAVGIANA
jgi:hypothetical protein